MEVDGKEFLRNVSLEQDKARLMEEQEKLERKKRDAVKQSTEESTIKLDTDDSAYIDLSFGKEHDNNHSTINQLQDIMLEPDSNNKNKKKYIILGFALILLFIITIVVIRIISNNSQEEQLNTQNQSTLTIDKDKILDKIDTKEEYEKVISQKKKTTDDLNINDIEKKEIILPEPIKEESPVVIEKPQNNDESPRDLFGMENDEVEQTPIVKKVEKPRPVQVKPKAKIEQVKVKIEKKKEVIAKRKATVIAPPKETSFAKSKQGTLQGYYVQVGAFSKKPSDKFLLNISKKGYSYTVHTMDIKGKIFNKVLIGSYPTKKTALKDIEKIKKDFNNKNAYILKF